MRVLLLVAAMAMLAGCHRAPQVMRTGSICVNETDVKNYKTNDFINVKTETVTSIGSEFTKNIKSRMGTDTKMQLVDCGSSDYQLITKLSNVNVENRQYNNGWTGQKLFLNNYDI